VVGDAFCATTHADLFLRATERGIEVKVIHNASIISAVGCSGLQVYRFGETVSVPLWTSSWRPDSWYDKIIQNRKAGLHTLVLVDIKVKERTEINILKDRKIYEPPRFMTIK
jgi:diphthine methyl ester synthase